MTRHKIFTPILIAGCVVLILNFGIRASFGVFQIPIATEFGWPRADFSMAIAIQNLAWGFGQPIFGALAERFGDRKAIIVGALMYAAGLVLSSFATTPGQMQALEILVGFGIAGSGFGMILAIVGRASSPENRSLSLGIASGIGSGGQVIGAPVAQALLQHYPWQTVFVIFAAAVLCVLFTLPFLRSTTTVATRHELEESMGTVLLRAFRDPSYLMIALGFFSCGYQLSFLTAHFPAFITQACGAIDPGGMLADFGITSTATLGAISLSVTGLSELKCLRGQRCLIASFFKRIKCFQRMQLSDVRTTSLSLKTVPRQMVPQSGTLLFNMNPSTMLSRGAPILEQLFRPVCYLRKRQSLLAFHCQQ